MEKIKVLFTHLYLNSSRGLLQPRLDCTLGTKSAETGKREIKARGERWEGEAFNLFPSFPALDTNTPGVEKNRANSLKNTS